MPVSNGVGRIRFRRRPLRFGWGSKDAVLTVRLFDRGVGEPRLTFSSKNMRVWITELGGDERIRAIVPVQDTFDGMKAPDLNRKFLLDLAGVDRKSIQTIWKIWKRCRIEAELRRMDDRSLLGKATFLPNAMSVGPEMTDASGHIRWALNLEIGYVYLAGKGLISATIDPGKAQDEVLAENMEQRGALVARMLDYRDGRALRV